MSSDVVRSPANSAAGSRVRLPSIQSLPHWITYKRWALPQDSADALNCDKPIDMCQLAQALLGWDVALSSSPDVAKVWRSVRQG